MKRRFFNCVVFSLMISGAANAATFRFDTDPFAGSTALSDPGRQVVGGEPFITFNIAADVFSMDPATFGVADTVMFLNSLASGIPSSGVNVVVLRDTPVPLAAGIAANLIAAQITAPGPGFFVYFNSGLDLPRLVYSTDLNDNTADLKILARLTNLAGQPGRDALPTFAAANFEFVPIPEPASILMTSAGLAFACVLAVRRRRAGASRISG